MRPDAVTPQTGEHAFSIWIKNAGEPCVLVGYPSVRLLDEHGSPLPVRFHQGGRYTTADPPREVDLPTGAEAVVIVAKFRCDLGPGQRATSALVRLPGTTKAASVAVTGNLEYCGGNGEGDADDVYVSPIEPDYQDATGLHP